MYIRGAMKIGLVASVKPSHPYLENDPVPLFDLHYLRISPWLWFRWHIMIDQNLPAGWITTTLGDAFQWRSGGTPRKTNSGYYGGEIPWAVIGDLNDGLIGETQNTITELALQESSARLVPIGAVLLAMYGSIGKLGISAIELATNQAIAFTESGLISNKYLFYYLLASRNALITLGKGDTQSNISQTVIKGFPFLLPPLPEQRRIVAEIEKQFTRLDASVAALRRTQANLKRYRASVLRAACSGELVPTEAELARAEGYEYEPASVLLERILVERRAHWETQEKRRGKYKEPAAPDTSNLPMLPEGWVNSTMGQCFEVYVGATPRRNREDYWGGEIAWVSSSEVAFNRITATRETITAAGYDNASVNLHPKGTVLLGMIGEGKTRGQVAILDIPACNSQNSAALRVSEVGLPPGFVFYYLMGQYEATRRIGSGNNQPALNKSRVQEIVLPLPPLAEQHRIVAEVERRLSVIQQAETAVEASLRRAERLRQSILKRAFCGELVPQDPDDEPASVLLERIRAQRESEQAEAAATKKGPTRRRRKSERSRSNHAIATSPRSSQ